MAASIDTDGLSYCNIHVLLEFPMAPQLLFTCVINQTFWAYYDYK